MDTHRTPATKAARPDAAQVAQFAADGYILLPRYFANRDAFNDVVESIVRDNLRERIFMRYEKPLSLGDLAYTYEDFATKSSMLRIPEIHSLSKELRRLVDACRFEALLQQYLPGRPKMSLLQSLYFPFSSNQASHSDKFLVSPPKMPYKRETLVGVWMALDGSSVENGALFGWTGSQEVRDKPVLSDYKQYGDYSRDLAVTMVNHGLQPHFIFAQPGDVVLWSSDFVHGGARPQVSNMTRRSLVLHYGSLEGPA